MYKILSIILCGFLGVLGVAYLVEKHNNSKHSKELNNQIAKLEGTIRETETVSSQRAVEVDEIKTENKELEKIIEDRNEKIISLTKFNLKLKDQLSKGNSAEESKTEDGRFRVDFKTTYPFQSEQPLLSVTGYTLTNPAYSELLFHWERNLNLNIIVSFDKKTKTFRTYLDLNNSDIVPADINFQMDPHAMDASWYEKISVSGGVLLSQHSASLRLGLMYDFLDNFSLGPAAMLGIGGNYMEKYYGVDFLWCVFK